MNERFDGENMNGERDLINEIDNVLTNRYVVLEGDGETLYVKDRETGRHFEIKVTWCDD